MLSHAFCLLILAAGSNIYRSLHNLILILTLLTAHLSVITVTVWLNSHPDAESLLNLECDH